LKREKILSKLVVSSLAGILISGAFFQGFSEDEEVEYPYYNNGNLNLFIGYKYLDKDWDPVDKEKEIGLRFDFGKGGILPHIAFDVFVSSEKKTKDNKEYKLDTIEVRIGLRKYFDIFWNFRVWFGLGIANIYYDVDVQDIFAFSTAEGSTGLFGSYWGDFGIDLLLFKHFDIGVLGSYSKGHLKENDEKVEIGGWHGGLFVGYSF
jgi:hypothetical protein